ncbi:hypothetical protein FB45DRAFT_784839 [Roridomyces roridus]|uniref:MYND-type domain-containing protein n=1 Tax=Roridomyces roridus TaxID=1738132 RepID=A0AAD7CCY0_9AGAR|nr:hypothetical protein FB45DRAFT_784839 [Roridomyces roridus]
MSQSVPPLRARIGLACYNCSKEGKISKCTGCRRVGYCSPECQKTNWKQHKPICKVLGVLETDIRAPHALVRPLPEEPIRDPEVLQSEIKEQAFWMIRFCEYQLCRDVTLEERNLIMWEPRCMACTRTDAIMRVEVASAAEFPWFQKQGPTPERLTPCKRCGLSFCCSPAHWDIARALHEAPGAGNNGLSQCDINCGIRTDTKVAEVLVSAVGDEFHWLPERTREEWTSLAEGTTSWEAELAQDMERTDEVPMGRARDPWARAASESLTMPMTILYALEQFNEGDAGTRKEKLIVHVLGADAKELMKGVVFEEILHRLPQVKDLEILFCGPELPVQRTPSSVQMKTCPDCTAQGRKRVHVVACNTYHGYIQTQGSQFIPPDLCIAFNSGAYEEWTDEWCATIKVLVERKIPSVFTAFSREEVHSDAHLLQRMGATLHPMLGPTKNPWGSMKLTPEPRNVYGFFADNAWFAGGFR